MKSVKNKNFEIVLSSLFLIGVVYYSYTSLTSSKTSCSCKNH